MSASVAEPADEVRNEQGDVQPDGQTRIEKDVGSILAGLNQEQLASIVAAARASEAGEQGQAQQGDFPATSDAPLDHLPPGLGQAASALTSFASSFKRSVNLPTEQEKLDDAPPPPGTEYQTEDPQRASAEEELKAKAAHDQATAAVIASLGSLAAQTSEQNSQAHGHDDGTGSPGSSRGGKRSRGSELDRQRKDNHKEVERRRRSAISDGIAQLSQIVPGCDAKNTNKSSIIVAAVRYIQDLKNNEASNIEKWTLEKLLMDQAMNDLTSQLDELRRENERLCAAAAGTEKRSHGADDDQERAKRQKVAEDE